MVPLNQRQKPRNERRHALRPLRTWLVQVLATLVVTACASQVEAGPAPETIAAWDRYVAQIEARIERERLSPAVMAAGSTPAGESINIPAGTISRWRGSVLLPGVSLDHVLHRLQYPGTPPPQEDVAAARVLSRGPDSLRVYIRLVRTAFVTVTYDTEHEMWFRRVSPTLATARSISTRIDEVGDDHGFLWRLNSYWRYRQTADGVVVELESVTLSRRIPAAIRPIAAPIVTRIARESTVRTLEALRLAFAAGL